MNSSFRTLNQSILHEKRLYFAALCFSAILLVPSIMQPVLAATIIVYVETQGRIANSTISGLPARTAFNTYYNLDTYLYVYTYDSENGYRADLDFDRSGSYFKITDNGSIVILQSRVLSSSIGGITTGDILKITIDSNGNTQKTENLSKKTTVDSVLAHDVIYRRTVSDGGTDTSSPSVSITAPSNGATVSGTIAVAASATDNVGVSKVMFYVDGVLKSTDTSSSYTYSLDTLLLSNALHNIKAVAYDAAGNQGSHQISVTVSNAILDTSSPSVSITAPSNGATVSGTISVSASASDNVGVSKVSFYVDNVLKGTDTTSPYSYSLDTTTLTNALHNIKAVAYDAAGNQGSHQISVTVSNSVSTSSPDTTAPTVSFIDPVNGETISGTVTVQVSATDNVGVNVVYFYVDGVNKGSDFAAPYTFSLDTTTIADGSHILKAKAFDKSNNQNYAEISVKVSDTAPAPSPTDTSSPSVSITSPASGATVSGTISVSASASDNVGVSKVLFYVDGVLKSTDSTSSYSFGLDTTTLTNALHSIKAVAYDAAGNQGSHQISVTVSNIAVDTVPPTVTITNPLDGETVTDAVQLKIIASDAQSGIAKIEIYIDGGLRATLTGTSSNTYSWIWNSDLDKNGWHTIQAIAYDKKGNTASADIEVKDTK